jgi:phosphoribosyl 1,2-cyclic phosphodiesterase
MQLKVLASGSSGNCYILESPTGSLLLECGIPWKKIQKRLEFDLSSVQGCLVTHCHKDHSKAVLDVMKAGIITYLSTGTCEALNIEHWACNSYWLSFARSKEKFQISDFDILPFDTEHDAPESLGFLIQYRPAGEKLLFLTDSYYCKYQFTGLNYIMIECNYIKETLDWNIENGYIHEAMKPRLLQSHMSLETLKDFLRANDLSQCREIILLHLSSQNADAERMVKEIADLTGIVPRIAKPGLEVGLEKFPY